MKRKTLEQRQRQDRFISVAIIVAVLVLFATIMALVTKQPPMCADYNTGQPLPCSSLSH